MRKLATALALSTTLMFGSCLAGPHQLQRTVGDWDQQLYVDSPWVDAVLWIIPIIPFANFGASIGDFFVTDAYAFWIKDAFSGEGGTGFRHVKIESKKSMGSLLGEGTFLQIDRGDSGM